MHSPPYSPSAGPTSCPARPSLCLHVAVELSQPSPRRCFSKAPGASTQACQAQGPAPQQHLPERAANRIFRVRTCGSNPGSDCLGTSLSLYFHDQETGTARCPTGQSGCEGLGVTTASSYELSLCTKNCPMCFSGLARCSRQPSEGTPCVQRS